MLIDNCEDCGHTYAEYCDGALHKFSGDTEWAVPGENCPYRKIEELEKENERLKEEVRDLQIAIYNYE